MFLKKYRLKNNFIVGSQIFLKKSDGTSQNLVLINHSKPEEPSIKYSEITNSKYEYTVVAIYEYGYRDDLITLITNQGIGDTVFIDDCQTDNSTYLHNLYGINLRYPIIYGMLSLILLIIAAIIFWKFK